MLLSMTGYGRVVKEFNQKAIQVEIKSLNSKFLDIKLKLSQNIRSRELDIRKIMTPTLIRGKVDVLIEIKPIGESTDYKLNKGLFKSYYTQLKDIASDLGITEGDYIQSIIRMPEIVDVSDNSITPEEWDFMEATIREAIEKLIVFRRTEGEVMEEDLAMRADNIASHLNEIEQHEEERKDKMRTKIETMLNDYVPKEAIDQNRFEQEVLYYLEKMDITEEKTRLSQHCKFFKEELEKEVKSKGKKLNFISQEMGREINTIGSKANNSKIQYWVVQMKDELEKIKEQLANSL